MKELGATDPKAMMLRFHTQTGGSTLTQQQPLNNISRVTIQALAAVLGGTQSLHTNGYDEALGLPTEQAAQVALRSQQIIAFESGASDTADPLGGSFYVEQLTSEMEQEIKKLIEYIDQKGGSVKVIEEGYMQEQIAASAYQYQRAIEEKQKIIVGVNQFTTVESSNTPIFKIDDEVRLAQVEKLKKLKSNRDQQKSTACLQAIKEAATSNTNLMPLVIEAVENYCTLGEISDTLRSVFGEHRQ